MDALIPIETTVIGTEEVNAVNGRELHGALEIKKDFSDWIKVQISSLGLEENVDYIVFPQKGENPISTQKEGYSVGGRPSIEYILTLDAAKHIAMASRSARGKAVRAYFIEVEKRYRLEGRTRNANANALSLSSDPDLPSLYERLLEAKEQIIALQKRLLAQKTPSPSSVPRRRDWSKQEDARLLALKAQGLSNAQIGQDLGRSRDSVRRRYERLRKRSQAHQEQGRIFGGWFGNGGAR